MRDWPFTRRLSPHDADIARVEGLECRLLMNGTLEPLTLAFSSFPLQYVEKEGAVPIDPDLTITDPNGGLIRSASVQLTGYIADEDSLSATAENGISISWNSSAGVLTLSGQASVSAYESALQSVTYTDGSYDPSTTPRIAQITASDAQFATGSASRTILITAVNDPPSILTPPIQTTDAGSPITFSLAGGNPIVISDVDANGAVEQVTLAASDGTLRFAQTAGLSFTAGASSSVATMTGTLPAINAALDGLTFTPSSSYASEASLEISADDLGNSGIGGAQMVNAIVPIIVNGPAAPPPPATTPVGASNPNTPTVGASLPIASPQPPALPTDPPAAPILSVRTGVPVRQIVEASGASLVAFALASAPRLFEADMVHPSYTSASIARSEPLDAVEQSHFLNLANSVDPTSSPREAVVLANGCPRRPGSLFADRLISAATPVGAGDSDQSFPVLHKTPAHRSFHKMAQSSAHTPMPTIGTGGLLRELDSIRQQVGADLRLRFWAGSASLLSGGLSLAYFLWVARGGSLLSGLLSSIPAWQVIDPLPILDQVGNSFAALRRNEERGLETLIKEASGN